jgi:hypothetical protein
MRPLLTAENATWAKVTSEIETAANELEAGDIFLISFSGHGSEISAGWLGRLASRPRSVEPGEWVQTWILWDRELLDKELRTMWTLFKPGVRILIVVDSCHSYSSYEWLGMMKPIDRSLDSGRSKPGFRLFPALVQEEVIDREKKYYTDQLNKALPAVTARERTGASVLSLAACRDGERAQDGKPHGLFTEKLLEVWSKGVRYSYRAFLSDIAERVTSKNSDQKPGISGYPDRESFADESPFAIAPNR